MELSSKQAHVLGRTAGRKLIPDAELRDTRLFATAIALTNHGVLRYGNWDDGGLGWRLSQYGLALIRVLEGRQCEWCDKSAVDARATQRAGCFVYFCQAHRGIAEASVESPTSERGSLQGLIRTGRIKPRQPDEVAT